MKTSIQHLLIVFSGILFITSTQLFAQTADTVDIAPLPVGNINTVIASDTASDGSRANPNRVYRLERGQIYQITNSMRINGSLKIIAAQGDARPPVLAPAINPDGQSIEYFFDFTSKGSRVEMHSIYLLSVRPDNATLGWSAGIRINADSINLVLRGVIFDAFSEAAIRIYKNWSKLDVQDCVFRNQQHGTSYFGGEVLLTDVRNHVDTCKFINNTFFANSSYIWSIRGFDRYSVFEHNTVVYGIVNPFIVRQASNLHMKNNIFYSTHSYGGIPKQILEGWFLNYPDTASSALIHIRTYDDQSPWFYSPGIANRQPISGPEAYLDEANGVFANMLTPESRVYEIRNNCYFWPQSLKDFYIVYNDTVQSVDNVLSASGGFTYTLVRRVRLPKFLTEYTQYTFSNLLAGKANLIIENNDETDPGFNSDIENHSIAVINYIKKIIRNNLDGDAWYYKSNGFLYPPAWPIPENLTYSNTALQNAGTDGYALGDLNWFPEQKAQWLYETVPVELSSFAAFPSELGITLNWTTASETNNSGFEVQRSNNKKNFLTVSFIDGKGTTSESNSYSYIDKDAKCGVNYYRLKQIDLDGTFNYSKTVEVNNVKPIMYELSQNYPNPFNPSTIIRYSIPESNFVTIKVFDILGNEVGTLVNERMEAGEYNIIFNAASLSAGVYLYTIKTGNFFDTKKLIIIK